MLNARCSDKTQQGQPVQSTELWWGVENKNMYIEDGVPQRIYISDTPGEVKIDWS